MPSFRKTEIGAVGYIHLDAKDVLAVSPAYGRPHDAVVCYRLADGVHWALVEGTPDEVRAKLV